MTAYLQHNTVQSVREFLASMDLEPSMFASSREVADLLVDRVRERRDDEAARRQFAELVEALRHSSFASPDRLPTEDSDSTDPRHLAAELARLLDGRPEGAGSRRIPATVMAAALLLVGAALHTGCESGPSLATCDGDTSPETFAAAVDDSTLGDVQAECAEEVYGRLGDDSKQEVIDDMCRMTPDEIANYLVERFASVPDDPEADECWDEAAAYKGVQF